jgi:hypothetical protein
MTATRGLSYLILIIGLLAACTSSSGDLVLRDGYRGPDDHCLSLGTLHTNDPNDDSPDTIACDVSVAERPDAQYMIDLGTRQGFDRYYIVPR